MSEYFSLCLYFKFPTITNTFDGHCVIVIITNFFRTVMKISTKISIIPIYENI